MMSCACFIEYMQQTREQIGLSAVLSREPAQKTYAISPGTFPSLGLMTLLYGLVGATRRSICIAVMTFLYLP